MFVSDDDRVGLTLGEGASLLSERELGGEGAFEFDGS